MRESSVFVPALVVLVAIIGLSGWWRYRRAQPIELVLFFHPVVGPEPLVLDEPRYPNPRGCDGP